MKRLILFLLILVSSYAFSQDTTKTTLAIKARLVQTLTPYVKQNVDDTLYSYLFNSWVKAYDVPTAPNATDIITVNNVSIPVIAALYGICQSFPQGAANVGNDFATDILSARSASNYLNTLCNAIDAILSNQVPDLRVRGRKILRGKSN